MSQRKCTLTLLEDTEFLHSKPTSLPMDPNTDGDPLPDYSLYICFAVNKLSEHMPSPQTSHSFDVHRLLIYLKGTAGQGLLFPSDCSLSIKAYSDAGSCVHTGRSTFGICIFIGSALLSWKSHNKKVVS